MKIISWNVNGIRAIEKKGFLTWLEKANPDILAIQETKAKKEQLNHTLLAPKFYQSFWHSAERPGYSGTALFLKKKAISVKTGLGKLFKDTEGRVIVAEYPKFSVICTYFPNSQAERNRLDFKIKFCNAIQKFCNQLKKEKKNYIICGDFNIAHTPIDLAHPETNENSPGYYIEERTWLDKFLKNGHIDTFRHFCSEPNHYTWWSYRTKARERNVGWRIDYHIVNKDFIYCIKSAEILASIYGSDHCPVSIELKL